MNKLIFAWLMVFVFSVFIASPVSATRCASAAGTCQTDSRGNTPQTRNLSSSGGTTTWTCVFDYSDYYHETSCSASDDSNNNSNRRVPFVFANCGNTNKTFVAQRPTKDLCSIGEPSAVGEVIPEDVDESNMFFDRIGSTMYKKAYTWTCTLNGRSTARCVAYQSNKVEEGAALEAVPPEGKVPFNPTLNATYLFPSGALSDRAIVWLNKYKDTARVLIQKQYDKKINYANSLRSSNLSSTKKLGERYAKEAQETYDRKLSTLNVTNAKSIEEYYNCVNGLGRYEIYSRLHFLRAPNCLSLYEARRAVTDPVYNARTGRALNLQYQYKCKVGDDWSQGTDKKTYKGCVYPNTGTYTASVLITNLDYFTSVKAYTEIVVTSDNQFCGDGVVSAEIGEQCDNGSNNGNDKACNLSCQKTYCGDGITQSPNGGGNGQTIKNEQCDGQPYCNSSCQIKAQVPGACGSAEDSAACTTPTQNLCNSGASSGVTEDKPNQRWRWNCGGTACSTVSYCAYQES